MHKKEFLLLITVFSFIGSIIFCITYFSLLKSQYNCPIYYINSNLYSRGNQEYTLTATIANRTSEEIFIETLIFQASGGKSRAQYSINAITLQPYSEYYINEDLISFGPNLFLYELTNIRPLSATIDGETFYLKQSFDGKDFGNNKPIYLILSVTLFISFITCGTIYILIHKDEIKQYFLNKKTKNSNRQLWRILNTINNKQYPFNNFNNEKNIITYLYKSFKRKLPLKEFKINQIISNSDKKIFIISIPKNNTITNLLNIGIIHTQKEEKLQIFQYYNDGEILICENSEFLGLFAYRLSKTEITADMENIFISYLKDYKENIE